MNKLITDLETGGVALLHQLTEPPTDGDQLPAEITGTVEHFASSLGLDTKLLGGPEKGFLFDLVNMAVEAVSAGSAGHAQAGAEPAAEHAAPAAEPGAVQEPPAEHAPPSSERQEPAAVESPPAAPLDTAPVQHGPPDIDLPPVTQPKEGYEICPKCAGFRTVLEGGKVTVCPECRGAGEVPVKAAPVA